MFEELGLNVARQSDNGANPRPDNRSGHLEGETPDLLEEYLKPAASAPQETADLGVRLWDPSTQLRYSAKRIVPPRPDGAPNRAPADWWKTHSVTSSETKHASDSVATGAD
jgi:biotin synthase